MALMIKICIEEEEDKKLNIVIWNSVDRENKPINNPVVDIKIPLKASSREIIFNKNIWNDIPAEEMTITDIQCESNENNEINATCESKNSENLVEKNLENDCTTENQNSEIDMICESKDSEISVEKTLEKSCSTKRNSISDILQENENWKKNLRKESFFNENSDEDLSLDSYLQYIRKKSEALLFIQNNIENINVEKIKNMKTCNETNSSQLKDVLNINCNDTMSIASDDYSLTIDDESVEKCGVQQFINGGANNQTQKVIYKPPYQTYVDIKLSPKKKFRCQLCNKMFAKKSSHSEHMKEVHELKFSCPICNVSFCLRRQLLLHFRRHSQKTITTSKRLLLSCSQCSRTYKSQKALNDHSKSHLPIQSRFFWRVAKINSNLSRQMKTKTLTVESAKSATVLK